LRAFTPIEQKAIRAAAETFRPNPSLDTERVIQELKVGEALVSVLHDKGEPSMVQRTLIRPPSGRIGPLTDAERRGLIEKSPFFGKYEDVVDRESAHEVLQKRSEAAAAEAEAVAKQAAADKNSWGNVIFGKGPRGGASMGEQIARDVSRSVMRSIITQAKNAIIKSIFKR
jgi:DNA helicase HerA-like ATPase